MNDPHIEALHYSVRHADDVDYDKADPLRHETAGFTVRIENYRAEITMKSDHPTVEAARAEVEPLLRAWELATALNSRPGEFKFAYDRATVVDRNPTPGSVNVSVTGAGNLTVTTRVRRSKYPAPPAPGIARDADVDLMFDRFCRYRAGTTTLADAANFCLTVLKSTRGRRTDTARHYAISDKVLRKLGELAATKGGSDARKVKGAKTEFTGAEQQWLEEAMKRLIWRAAELAGGQSAPLPQITMADLPSLPKA